mgnify:CR=1 FL=1
MALLREKALQGAGIVSLIFGLLISTHSLQAQDNSQGRYRPEGRQIGLAIGRELDERLYEVRTYETEVTSEAFAGAVVFYPLTLSFDPPNGAVAFMPGFRAPASIYEWWGPALASLGYSVFILETNTPTDSLAARADALIAAVDFIKSENQNSSAPVADKIDIEKIAIMGHSMGGGASLLAATQIEDDIKAVIPLALYCCEPGQSFSGDYGNLEVPAMIIASTEDEVAPPGDHAKLLYDSIGGSRTYIEFASGDHMFVSNSGEEKAALSRFVLAFLKDNLDGRNHLESLNEESTELTLFLTE